MRQVSLTEYIPTPCVPLLPTECATLKKFNADIAISPSADIPGSYDLTPASKIGVIQLPHLAILIRPKIDIGRVLFLLSYAMDPKHWQDVGFDFQEKHSLVEAIAPGFLRQIRKAVHRGILKNYRLEETILPTVRGRLRLNEQIKRRYGNMPPIEVAFNEFTEDIKENRLLKAALFSLARIRFRSTETQHQLWHLQAIFDAVASINYDPRHLPHIHYTRLNAHYRPAIDLAKRILRAFSYDLGPGDVPGITFLIDINDVFEEFVLIALREALNLPDWKFPSACGRHSLSLDRARNINLVPDLSWWEDAVCLFVGDVKYKRVNARGIKNPDLYQLLAYTVGAGLPTGLLIYAAGEGVPAVHEVFDIGKKLRVTSVDLSGEPEQILAEIRTIATIVQAFKKENQLRYSTASVRRNRI